MSFYWEIPVCLWQFYSSRNQDIPISGSNNWKKWKPAVLNLFLIKLGHMHWKLEIIFSKWVSLNHSFQKFSPNWSFNFLNFVLELPSNNIHVKCKTEMRTTTPTSELLNNRFMILNILRKLSPVLKDFWCQVVKICWRVKMNLQEVISVF